MSTGGIGGASSNSALYQQMLKRTQAADSARAQRTGGEYDQAQYLRELNERFDANIISGVWNGKDKFDHGSPNGTVMIHPDFLRVMHDDPAIAAKYEETINTFAKTNAEAKKLAESQGRTLTSSGMYIDEKGEISSYAVMESSDDGKSSGPKTLKELMEEMMERLEEKQREEMAKAKQLAGKEAADTSTETGRIVDTMA